MTLIEIMISMAIGMFLILGAVTVYTQGRYSFQVTEGTSRIQENLRFAFDVMEPDIRMAGFWGMHRDASSFQSGAADITCGGNAVTAWAMDHEIGFTARNDITSANKLNVAANARNAASCPAHNSGVKEGTDIVEVRRASSSAQPLAAGTVQVQSQRNKSHLMTDGTLPGGYSADTDISNTYNYIFNTYYIANESQNYPGIPSLRRRTLVGTEVVDEEIIAGVEDMQVQLGIDVDFDGSVDRYVDPVPGAVGVADTIIAVRLWLLMRAEEEERGLQDKRVYVKPDGEVLEPNDAFRRLKGSKTILLRNARS